MPFPSIAPRCPGLMLVLHGGVAVSLAAGPVEQKCVNEASHKVLRLGFAFGF